jgi:hypothetical protein
LAALLAGKTQMAGPAEPLVGAYGLLIAFAAQGDDLALGRLTGVLADLLHPAARRRGVLALLCGAGLQQRLYSAEFLEGVGAERLNSRRLVRHTFRQAQGSAAAASRGLGALAAAGVLNLHSRGALAALHAGMAAWHLDGRVQLVGRLAGEMETFAQVGLFLRLLLDSPAWAGGAREAEALLRGVVAQEDVRDLAGPRKDLTDALPEHARAILEGLGAADSEGSDADDDGNLAGFVCGDSEVEFSTSEEEEGGGVAAAAPKRRASAAAAAAPKLKRLRRQ